MQNGWKTLSNPPVLTPSIFSRQLPGSRQLTLAGLLSAGLLIGMAVILLGQLLAFPSNSPQQITAIFTDARIIKTTMFTLFQAALSTLLSLLFAIVISWALAGQRSFRFRPLLIAMMSSALVLPTLVVVLGLVSVYGRAGWLAFLWQYGSGNSLPFSIYGMGGILLAHVFFNAAFAASVLLQRLEAIPRQTQKLSFSLGLGTLRKFLLVELPAIIPALPALAITIFLLCFTSFAIVLTLGGSPAYNTLEVSIYEAVKFDFDLVRAFQLSLVQITICIILVLAASVMPMPQIAAMRIAQDYGFQHLLSARVKLGQGVIISLFAIFLLAPISAVIIDGINPGLTGTLRDPVFVNALTTSLMIASLAAVVTLTFSLLLSSALVNYSSPDLQSKKQRPSLPYAFLSIASMLYLVFPALVMGLGFFLLFQQFGTNTTRWAWFVVVFANSVVALPFAVATLRPAMAAIALKNDRLSLSLGLGFRQRIWMINIPQLKSEIAWVTALAFCFSLGDLGVIALFGSDDFKTLPWLLYQKFGSYRTSDASTIALVMLALVWSVFAAAQIAGNRAKGKIP